MQFRNDRPIYLQIVESLHEQVLSGALVAEDRVPAVRDLAVQLQVNPNTVVKSFGELEESGVIYKKRGLGYFVSADARERVLASRRQDFLANDVPAFLKTMKLLGLDWEEIQEKFQNLTTRE